MIIVVNVRIEKIGVVVVLVVAVGSARSVDEVGVVPVGYGRNVVVVLVVAVGPTRSVDEVSVVPVGYGRNIVVVLVVTVGPTRSVDEVGVVAGAWDAAGVSIWSL